MKREKAEGQAKFQHLFNLLTRRDGKASKDFKERRNLTNIFASFLWFLKKLNIRLSFDPAILLLGMYPQNLKAGAL